MLAVIFSGGMMFYTLLIGPQKRAKELGLICPACDKSLLGRRAQPGLVTGQCGFCRAKVLEP